MDEKFIIFYFIHKQFEHEITEQQFLEVFKSLKNKKDLESLEIEFRSMFTKNMFEVINQKLPDDVKIKMHYYLNMLYMNPFQKFIYKLKNIFNGK